jgi:hypothetical protein
MADYCISCLHMVLLLFLLQNQLELVGSAAGQPGGQALAAAWHAALEASAGVHFPGNQLINCMCHNTNVSRCSLHVVLVSGNFFALFGSTGDCTVCDRRSMYATAAAISTVWPHGLSVNTGRLPA